MGVAVQGQVRDARNMSGMAGVSELHRISQAKHLRVLRAKSYDDHVVVLALNEVNPLHSVYIYCKRPLTSPLQY